MVHNTEFATASNYAHKKVFPIWCLVICNDHAAIAHTHPHYHLPKIDHMQYAGIQVTYVTLQACIISSLKFKHGKHNLDLI